MILGLVKWFGGSNKKTGRINDFGFFDSIADSERGDVYVRRQDVPLHIQQSLETGTYVSFSIYENDRGQEYATDVELALLVGTVIWFSNGIGYIRHEGYVGIKADIKIESLEEFKSGDVVAFYARYNSKLNKSYAFSIQKVSESVQDEMLVELCALSNRIAVCKPFIAKYANSLPEDAAIQFVVEKVGSINSKEQQDILKELIEKSEKLLLQSSKLRSKVKTSVEEDNYSEQSASAYWQFIDKYVHHASDSSDSIKQELIVEVQSKLTVASEKTKSAYWNHSNFLKSSLEYKGVFWDVAPVAAKSELIRRRYSRFFDLASSFENSKYPFSDSISCNWKKLYELDDIDERLTQLWCSSSNNTWEKTKMISARGAEKLVLRFFNAMEHEVEDIAAHQANQQSDTWKQADVRIDSQHLLDVKNARTALHSDVYSEFCVPTFKQNRIDRDNHSEVFIVAVLSPYIQDRYVFNLTSPHHSINDPLVLGVFSRKQLERLEKNLNDSTLSISLSRGLDPKKYLPPWFFDYSARFYQEQNDIKRILLQLEDTEIPTWEDLCLIKEFSSLYLSPFIASRRSIPESWISHLPAWQVEFVQILFDIQHKSKDISLPCLFLAILKHFLKMLSHEDYSYSPKKYANLLYPSVSSVHPLKLYDPLNIIKDFCGTLQLLWDNRVETNLISFKVFKFNGRGLLQGKRLRNEPSWTTILAYCGGYVEGKGKCGYAPLVIGHHRTCTKCGHLICPKEDCQYCSQYCDGKETNHLHTF